MDVEEWIESIVRGLMCLAGILGNNWLAFSSLPRSKSPLRTNKVLFINLAVSNLITTYLVDLPDTIADFADRWFLGETYCGIFRFCADLSETSSIFTTFFISVFWYQKLVGSLKRGGAPVQLDSLCLVAWLLAGSWTVAVVFSIPHLFFVTVGGGNESHEDCTEVFPNPFARQTYDTLYLTLANAMPLVGIVYASVQIVITLQNQKPIHGLNSEATKGTVKDSTKDPERIYDERSISTVDNHGNRGSSGDNRDFPSVTNTHSNLPGSCSDGGPSGHSSPSSPLYSEANKENRIKAPPDPSKPSQAPAKLSPGLGTQVRAAKSVVAVASVFLVCWLTHLLLRITNNIHTSSIVVEVASYIAASYTCIIPYIFLHGVKKLSCPCRG